MGHHYKRRRGALRATGSAAARPDYIQKEGGAVLRLLGAQPAPQEEEGKRGECEVSRKGQVQREGARCNLYTMHILGLPGIGAKVCKWTPKDTGCEEQEEDGSDQRHKSARIRGEITISAAFHHEYTLILRKF